MQFVPSHRSLKVEFAAAVKLLPTGSNRDAMIPRGLGAYALRPTITTTLETRVALPMQVSCRLGGAAPKPEGMRIPIGFHNELPQFYICESGIDNGLSYHGNGVARRPECVRRISASSTAKPLLVPESLEQ